MNLFFSRSTQLIIVSCVLLLFFLWVAFPTQYFFLNDDFIHVPLAGGGSFLNRSFVRPVSDITLYIDHMLWQKNATGYHLTNVLLHLACTLCLFVFASKLFRRFSPVPGFDGRPWLAAFMFLVNGCQTESVFWIIGRGGSLAALFGLLSLICYLNKERGKWWLGLALVFFMVGLFAYEVTAAVILIILWLSIAERRVNKSKSLNIYPLLGFGLMLLIYLIYRMATGGFLNDYQQAPLQYIGRIFFRIHSLLARSLVPPLGAVPLLILYLGLIMLTVIAALGLIRKNKNPLLLQGLAVSIIALVLPFAGFGADTHDSESGRFVYFSAAIGCVFIAELLTQLVNRANVRLVFGALLICIHAWFFYSTAKHYQLAGQVVRQSLECLRGASGYVELEDAPAQYHGALIFRSGLPEAMQWYNNDKVQVKIISSNEIAAVKRLTCEMGDKSSQLTYKWTDSSVIRFQP